MVLLPSVIALIMLLVSALVVLTKPAIDVLRLKAYLIAALALCLAANLWFCWFVHRLILSKLDHFKARISSVVPKSDAAGLAGDDLDAIAALLDKTIAALTISEQRERALVDYALDVVCALSLDGRFLAVSPASLRCWGYVPDNLIGKPLTQYLPKEDAGRVLELLKLTEDKEQFETRIVRPDGKLIDAHWSITRSKTDDILFCIVADITQRKELERTKQQFVAMITHELRTPLSSFLFTLQLLLKGHYGALTAEGNEHIAGTEADVDRLIGLINELLDLEKMDAREFAVTLAPVSLFDVFERSRNAVSGVAAPGQIKLDIQPTSAKVLGDRDRLVQVVTNILSNAIKFSPNQGIVVVHTEQRGKFVEVRVSDKGPGINLVNQSVIFERFKSIDRPGINSTGLGLPICKGIVEAHGGEIGVDSVPDLGSTFWFTLRSA